MKRIAICGNIASGKSTVQRIIEEFGYKVLDTDDVAHELLTVKNQKLFDTFKNLDVFENGEFSRTKLGKIVFSDIQLKEKLEKVLHPQIRQKIVEFFCLNNDEKILFVGIPLLFESNMTDLFDVIIFIYTDDDIRLKRLLKRNAYTLEHAKARMNSQMTQERKAQNSNYILYNNGSVEELNLRVKNMLCHIIS